MNSGLPDFPVPIITLFNSSSMPLLVPKDDDYLRLIGNPVQASDNTWLYCRRMQLDYDCCTYSVCVG